MPGRPGQARPVAGRPVAGAVRQPAEALAGMVAGVSAARHRRDAAHRRGGTRGGAWRQGCAARCGRPCRRGLQVTVLRACPVQPRPWLPRRALWHGSPGRRRGRGGRGCGVDRDRELDVAAELAGQGMGDQRAQPGLELFLDELVGRGDERGVLDEPERPGQPQPGPLMWFDVQVRQLFQRPGPDLPEIGLAHRAPPQCDQQSYPQAVHAAYHLVRGEACVAGTQRPTIADVLGSVQPDRLSTA